MICPRCMQDNTTTVGTTHYICNNENCLDDNGKRTQFIVEYDDYIRFPYNVIFPNRNKKEFYRKQYLKM